MPPTNADRRYKLPSMEMMESIFLPDPQDFHYDPVPLKRILRCAILAKLRLTGYDAGPAKVSRTIADAKGPKSLRAQLPWTLEQIIAHVTQTRHRI